jgi:DNA replication protein DnaC
MNKLFESMPDRTEVCASHGEYESKNYMGKVWSKCPECSRIESKQREAEERAKEAEDKVKRWEARINTACIPKRFSNRTLDTYNAATPEQERALKFCLDFVSGFDDVKETGRGAIFCGLPGTGKTHLAVGVCIELMRHRGEKALFTTVMRAIRRIKSTWDRDSNETESQAIEVYTQPDLLVLDEVGVQFGSETEENYIFDIINERYEEQRPTIIISNLDVDGIKKYLGDRAFDRMKEDGGKLIPFTWGSYRGTAPSNQPTKR